MKPGVPGCCGRRSPARPPRRPAAPTAGASAGARGRVAGRPHPHTPTALAACGGGLVFHCQFQSNCNQAPLARTLQPGDAAVGRCFGVLVPRRCRQAGGGAARRTHCVPAAGLCPVCVQAVAMYPRSPAVAAQRRPVQELAEALGRQVAAQLQDDVWGDCWPVPLLRNVQLGSMFPSAIMHHKPSARCMTGCRTSVTCSACRSIPGLTAGCGPCAI